MSSDTIVRDLFRSLETVIHERLATIEDVIRLGNNRDEDASTGDIQSELADKLATLTNALDSFSARLSALEARFHDSKSAPSSAEPTVHVNRIGSEQADTLYINPMKDLKIQLVEPTPAPQSSPVLVSAPVGPIPTPFTMTSQNIPEEVEEEEGEVAEESDEEEVEEGEVADEVEEGEVVEEPVVVPEPVKGKSATKEIPMEVEEEEDADDEAEEEDEEAEEGEELEEFEYKGKTYYRDSENLVYVLNEEEEPVQVGTWDTTRERVLFKRIAG
jgi:hypothetical protein